MSPDRLAKRGVKSAGQDILCIFWTYIGIGGRGGGGGFQNTQSPPPSYAQTFMINTSKKLLQQKNSIARSL